MNLHLFTIPLSSHDLLSFPFFLFFNLILHTTPTFPDKRNILRSSNNSTFNSIHRRIHIYTLKKKKHKINIFLPSKISRSSSSAKRATPLISSCKFIRVYQPITYFLASSGWGKRAYFSREWAKWARRRGGDGPRLLGSIGPFTFFFFFSLPFLFSFFHGGTKGQPRRLSKSHVRRLDRVALVRNNHESGAGSALGSSGQPRLIVLEWFGPDARSTDRQRVREIPISWDGKIVFFF